MKKLIERIKHFKEKNDIEMLGNFYLTLNYEHLENEKYDLNIISHNNTFSISLTKTGKQILRYETSTYEKFDKQISHMISDLEDMIE